MNHYFITATGEQQLPISNTIGRAIVDAVVRAGKEGRKLRVIIMIPAVPGFAGDLRDDGATGTRAIMDYQYKSICRGEHSIFEQVRAQGVEPEKHIFLFNLRSYDRLNKTPAIKHQEEESGVTYQEVQRAQAEEIMGEGIHGTIDVDGGRDSHMGGKKEQEDMDIQKEGRKSDRAEEAIDAKRRFESAKEDGQGVGTAYSVARHAMANEGPLSDEPWEGDAKDEVENWIQEELYIHSKLAIVDDRVVICGSSNINDRSQEGHHDSELSIVMEDTRKIESKMDGKLFQAGYMATTLRRYLWREHLGLLPGHGLDASNDKNAQPPGAESPNDVVDQDDSWKFVEDPLGDDLWDMWTSRATTNTEIFRHLFHADPDDNGELSFFRLCISSKAMNMLEALIYMDSVKTFDDYNKFLPPRGVKSGHIFDRFIPPEDVRSKLEQIKGHLVWMPLDFLKDAEMAEKGLQVNQFTESVFT